MWAGLIGLVIAGCAGSGQRLGAEGIGRDGALGEKLGASAGEEVDDRQAGVGAGGRPWTPLSLTRDGRATLTLVDGRGGRLVISRRAETSQTRWRVWRYVADSTGHIAPEANVQQVYAVDAGGTVRLEEEINRDEGVEVVYQPGLIVMDGGAQVGEVWEHTLRMVVHPLGDRSRVRTQGAAKRTGVIEAVESAAREGEQGGGVMIRVRNVLEAELSAARVVNETTHWYQSGVGLVKEVERERTKVMGITVRDNAHEWTVEK